MSKFAKLEGQLASRPGVKNPGALAASIGRKRLGEKKMEQKSEAGRKKASYGDAFGK